RFRCKFVLQSQFLSFLFEILDGLRRSHQRNMDVIKTEPREEGFIRRLTRDPIRCFVGQSEVELLAGLGGEIEVCAERREESGFTRSPTDADGSVEALLIGEIFGATEVPFACEKCRITCCFERFGNGV